MSFRDDYYTHYEADAAAFERRFAEPMDRPDPCEYEDRDDFEIDAETQEMIDADPGPEFPIEAMVID